MYVLEKPFVSKLIHYQPRLSSLSLSPRGMINGSSPMQNHLRLSPDQKRSLRDIFLHPDGYSHNLGRGCVALDRIGKMANNHDIAFCIAKSWNQTV